MNSLGRTNIGASPAIRTDIGINFINIAFRDSFYRAFTDTSATSSTIATNYMCHKIIYFLKFIPTKVDVSFLRKTHLRGKILKNVQFRISLDKKNMF
jgi:hypothetical protein